MRDRINKTRTMAQHLRAVHSDLIGNPNAVSGPDCRNRHPGTGWEWSPSGTATRAASMVGLPLAPCWHGSLPTPGTQMPAAVAVTCRHFEQMWNAWIN